MKAVRLKEVSPLDDLRALARSARGTGRKVPEELKARAVELYVGGYSANEVALAAGVHSTNLYKWSRGRAPRSAFRELDLSNAPAECAEVALAIDPHGAPTSTCAAATVDEGVVFHFPKGTSVVLPTSCVTPLMIEALLCLEREVGQ